MPMAFPYSEDDNTGMACLLFGVFMVKSGRPIFRSCLIAEMPSLWPVTAHPLQLAESILYGSIQLLLYKLDHGKLPTTLRSRLSPDTPSNRAALSFPPS